MNVKILHKTIQITTNHWNVFVDEFGTYIRLIDGRLIRKLTHKGFRWRDREWTIDNCGALIEQAQIELKCL